MQLEKLLGMSEPLYQVSGMRVRGGATSRLFAANIGTPKIQVWKVIKKGTTHDFEVLIFSTILDRTFRLSLGIPPKHTAQPEAPCRARQDLVP